MTDREKVTDELQLLRDFLMSEERKAFKGNNNSDVNVLMHYRNIVIDAIVLLKKQEQQRWILCSDRFPKSEPDDLEYPIVIIALKDGTVELGCYFESTKEWGAGENFDRPRKPVAWMPLPMFHKERQWNGMDNISETIRRLEKIAIHAVHCAGEPSFVMSLDDGIAIHEAIDLMKKQEPVEPIKMQRMDDNFSFFVPYFLCGNCRYELVGKDVMFCSHCGRPVKWE